MGERERQREKVTGEREREGKRDTEREKVRENMTQSWYPNTSLMPDVNR